ncbi:hypothetical protein GGF32_003304 [Allomyces javanicus]|nr:hypothetical protein GGF32_003304 [Allomyces javanicus]
MSATSAGSSTTVSATAPNFALTLVYAFLDESPCQSSSGSSARLVLGGNLTCTSTDKSVLADPWHFQWSFTTSTAQLAGYWARDGAKVTTFANQPRPTITGGGSNSTVDIFDVAVVAPSSNPGTARTDSVVFNVTLPCPTKLDDASRGDLATAIQPATWAMQFASSQVSYYVIGQAGTNQSQALRDQVVRKSVPASVTPAAPLTYVATASASTGGGGSSASSSGNSNSSTATASLVAIVLLSVGVALLVVVILLCLRRRRGSKSNSSGKTSHESMTTTTARGHGPGHEVWRSVPATSSIPSSPAPVARTMVPNMDAAMSPRARPGSWIEQQRTWAAAVPEPTSPQAPPGGAGYWDQQNVGGPQFPRIDPTGPPMTRQMQMQVPQYDDRVEPLSPRSNWAPAPLPPPPPQSLQQQPAWSPRAQPSRFDPVSTPPQMTLAPSPFQNPPGGAAPRADSATQTQTPPPRRDASTSPIVLNRMAAPQTAAPMMQGSQLGSGGARPKLMMMMAQGPPPPPRALGTETRAAPASRSVNSSTAAPSPGPRAPAPEPAPAIPASAAAKPDSPAQDPARTREQELFETLTRLLQEHQDQWRQRPDLPRAPAPASHDLPAPVIAPAAAGGDLDPHSSSQRDSGQDSSQSHDLAPLDEDKPPSRRPTPTPILLYSPRMSPTGFIDSDDEDGGVRPIPPPPVDAPVPNVPDAQQRLFRHPLPQLTITIPDIYVTPPSNTTPSVDYPPYFDDDEDEEGDIDDRVSEDSRLPGGDFERHEYDYDDYEHDGHRWGYDDEYGDENDMHPSTPAVDPWGPQSATAQYYAASPSVRPSSPYRTTPESDLVDSEPSDPSITSEPSPFADDGHHVEPFPSLPRSAPVPTSMAHAAETPASPVSPTSPASFGSGGGGGVWGTLRSTGSHDSPPPPVTRRFNTMDSITSAGSSGTHHGHGHAHGHRKRDSVTVPSPIPPPSSDPATIEKPGSPPPRRSTSSRAHGRRSLVGASAAMSSSSSPTSPASPRAPVAAPGSDPSVPELYARAEHAANTVRDLLLSQLERQQRVQQQRMELHGRFSQPTSPTSEFPPSLGSGDRAGAQRTPPSPRREADLLRQLDELQRELEAMSEVGSPPPPPPEPEPVKVAAAPVAPHNVYSPPPVAVRGPPPQQQPLTQQVQQQQLGSVDDSAAGSGYVPPPQFVNPNRVVRSPILGRFEPSSGLTGWGQNDVPARR